MIRIGEVQPAPDGFAFTIQYDAQPARIVTYTFTTRQEAETVRGAVLLALTPTVGKPAH